MEEQTERKAATAVAEEPIKAEGTVETPDTSERSDGAASPPPNCSICLGKLINTSFTDSCLHQFCFTCLLQWSKIKTECPLCKQTFKSIIHNVRSEEDYDQYHVPRELASQVATATLDVNFDIVGNVGTVGVSAIGSNWDIPRFMYRSTLGNPSRRIGMIINRHEVARREQLPSIAPQLSRDELRRRQINPSDFRRNVYRLGAWATPLPDVFGRFRECSAELYRRHPAEINRLIPWLNRELQVLLNNNSPHVAYVLGIITDALTRYYIRSAEFRNLIRPYFGVHTDHFTHELANFARTSFDMVGYDQSVVYLPNRAEYTTDFGARILSPGSSSSSLTSDDSDIRVVDESVDRRGLDLRISTLMPNSIDMPGPSTLGRAFHPYVPTYTVPDVVVVSSSSSSSGSDDECEVIGYVKPRHERTPEIIDLSHSEAEEPIAQPIEINETLPSPIVIDEIQPSTSNEAKRQAARKIDSSFLIQMMEISSSPTFSETSDSDSDYTPKRKHKVCTKKSKKSSRAVQAKKHKRPTIKKNVKTLKRSLSHVSFSSSSDSDSKHTKRAAKKETKRRRVSVSSGSNSEKFKKKTSKSKSKKREVLDSNSDSASDESSESDIEGVESYSQKIMKRTYSSSSDTSTSSSKSREKTRETRRTSRKSEKNNSRFKKCENQSESDTFYECSETDKLKLPQYNSCEHDDTKKVQDKSDPQSSCYNETTTTENDDLTGKNILYGESSTDRSVGDLEQHRYYRSRSQCSVCSDNTRTNKRKSKHKEKRNHKSDKTSTKFYSSTDGNSINSSNDTPPSTSKHSESKSNSRSRSKNKHKSHKKSKTSKRRKSRSNSRSKSKRKITADFQT